jgi:cyclopropane-fatty-acyl-phospholipid synthase
VLSVETFEHTRNWKALLRRVAAQLKPDGKAFVHLFSHRDLAYRFEGTWAAERFYAGGTMPSHDLLLRFQDDLVVTDRWAVNGTHYARTLRAWLERLDAHSEQALEVLADRRQLAAWRLFLISAAEMWGSRDGNEWLVSHYLLTLRDGSSRSS